MIVTNCSNCSAPLEGADLERPNCRFCGAVHPHIARAAEKVEVVKQLLAPGPNGMPVALAAMMGHTGATPPPGGHGVGAGAGMGMGASVTSKASVASFVMVNGVVVQAGQSPPMGGGPVGGFAGGPAGGPMGAYGAPPAGGFGQHAPGYGSPAYGSLHAAQAQAMAATQHARHAGKIALVVGLAVALVALGLAAVIVWTMV